jgi:phenylalanine-4-hydroxylase
MKLQKELQYNEILKRLPKHLLQYVVDQNYNHYTPVDQAVWRHVMHKNVEYLPSVAHQSYLDGLKATGISTEEIPSMYGMNRILKDIGWAAVAVDGLIPSAAFMEFQAYNVLVIAADIRKSDHIEYTPAPDIIHESAGHAPIIANPEYAEYLRRMGEIGYRAISSAKDQEFFEAMRNLAIVKENINSTPKDIDDAEQRVIYVQNNMGEPSEMSLIKNLHWWTVEYGLIGDLKNPKIYGAGLLSSIGESKSCLRDHIKKLPYTIEAAYQNFDVTKPQPQLFVTPDFAHLSFVLEEFANTMAIRKGGISGVKKLIDSGQLGTAEYNTGLQISGIFKDLIKDENNNLIYIQTSGPTALSYQQKELIGHGTYAHPHGFGSPVGKLRNINIPIEKMSPYDLSAYKIREGERIKLDFEGGIRVEGLVITGKRNLQGTIILITFKDCTVSHFDRLLFTPEMGLYHMAVGITISSAFSGPADYDSFDLITHKTNHESNQTVKTDKQIRLEKLYSKIRTFRIINNIDMIKINQIKNELKSNYPEDWLLLHEISEIEQLLATEVNSKP